MAKVKRFSSFVDVVNAYKNGEVSLPRALLMLENAEFPNGKEQNENHIAVRRLLYDLGRAVFPANAIVDLNWNIGSVAEFHQPHLVLTIETNMRFEEVEIEYFYVTFWAAKWPRGWFGCEPTQARDFFVKEPVRISDLAGMRHAANLLVGFVKENPDFNDYDDIYPTDQYPELTFNG